MTEVRQEILRLAKKVIPDVSRVADSPVRAK